MAVTCSQMMCSGNTTKSEVNEVVNHQVDAQVEPRLPRPKPYSIALIALLLEPGLNQLTA